MAHQQGGGEAQAKDQQPREKGRIAPAPVGQAPDHQRDQQAADTHAGHRDTQRRGALAGEPVGNGGGDWDKAAETRTEGDKGTRQVKIPERIDVAEVNITGAEERNADLHHDLGAAALDQLAL